MKNILLENVDVIFGIARQNNKPVDIGMDMFRANLNAGEERYKGAPERRVPDYTDLGIIWSAMSDEEQRAATNAYVVAVNEHYNDLVELSQAEDYAGMVMLVAPAEE